jgi:hypothetical protein
MIRKLKSGEYRLYSRKVSPKTGRRCNLNSGRRASEGPLLSTDLPGRVSRFSHFRDFSQCRPAAPHPSPVSNR